LATRRRRWPQQMSAPRIKTNGAMKQNKEYSICGTDPFTEAAKGGKRRQLPESNCDKGQQVRCRLWPLFAARFLAAFFPQRTRWGMVSTQNSAFHTVRFFAFSRFA